MMPTSVHAPIQVLIEGMCEAAIAQITTELPNAHKTPVRYWCRRVIQTYTRISDAMSTMALCSTRIAMYNTVSMVRDLRTISGTNAVQRLASQIIGWH